MLCRQTGPSTSALLPGEPALGAKGSPEPLAWLRRMKLGAFNRIRGPHVPHHAGPCWPRAGPGLSLATTPGCYELSCVPRDAADGFLREPVNVAFFGNRVFADVIKLK